MGDRPKTRRGQSTREDLKAVVDEALAPIKEEIAKLPEMDAINLLLNKLGTSIKSEFEEQLKSRDDRIIALKNKIEMLEGKLCVIDRLDKRIDDGAFILLLTIAALALKVVFQLSYFVR